MEDWPPLCGVGPPGHPSRASSVCFVPGWGSSRIFHKGPNHHQDWASEKLTKWTSPTAKGSPARHQMSHLSKTFPEGTNNSQICPKRMSDTLAPGSKGFSLLAASCFLLLPSSKSPHAQRGTWQSSTLFWFAITATIFSMANWLCFATQCYLVRLMNNSELNSRGEIHRQQVTRQQRLCPFKYKAQGQEHGLHRNSSLINVYLTSHWKEYCRLNVYQILEILQSCSLASLPILHNITSQVSSLTFHVYLLNRLLI